MKPARIWLPLMTAVALTAPVCAQQVNAPESRWHQPAIETSMVNWPRLAWDAQDLASAQQTATPQPTHESASPPAPATSSANTSSNPPASSSERNTIQPSMTTQKAQETQRQTAEKQIKEQESQRVLGIVPAFNVSYRSNAVSLTGMQKMRLAFRSSIDPVTFATAFLVAGYHEVANDVDFGWGAKGYFQRAGAAYLDTFNSNMIGNGILPALLHQDPRYFRLGHGTTPHRLLYAAAAAFVCKHDNTGKWEPNYSNVMGNIATGAISTLYYPGSDSGVGLAIENGIIVTAEGAFGAMFQEFWPDISRKLFHKDPTEGRDAQIRAPKSNGQAQSK